jgi:hypothetical protein
MPDLILLPEFSLKIPLNLAVKTLSLVIQEFIPIKGSAILFHSPSVLIKFPIVRTIF